MDENSQGLTNAQANKIATELDKSAYDGDVHSRNKRQKVSDEQLQTIFRQVNGKWFKVTDLQRILGSVITVHDPIKDEKAAVGSNYLARLKLLTGKPWRQKSGVDEKGNTVVKIYSVK
jgi:hypothetical protein